MCKHLMQLINQGIHWCELQLDNYPNCEDCQYKEEIEWDDSSIDEESTVQVDKNKEVLKEAFRQKYFNLCSEFMNFCLFQYKGDTSKQLKDIPEVTEYHHKINEFKRLVKEYFNLEWNQDEYCFKEIK